jgi:hypothetical protein
VRVQRAGASVATPKLPLGTLFTCVVEKIAARIPARREQVRRLLDRLHLVAHGDPRAVRQRADLQGGGVGAGRWVPWRSPASRAATAAGGVTQRRGLAEPPPRPRAFRPVRPRLRYSIAGAALVATGKQAVCCPRRERLDLDLTAQGFLLPVVYPGTHAPYNTASWPPLRCHNHDCRHRRHAPASAAGAPAPRACPGLPPQFWAKFTAALHPRFIPSPLSSPASAHPLAAPHARGNSRLYRLRGRFFVRRH